MRAGGDQRFVKEVLEFGDLLIVSNMVLLNLSAIRYRG
jgi:hypothetical protein